MDTRPFGVNQFWKVLGKNLPPFIVYILNPEPNKRDIATAFTIGAFFGIFLTYLFIRIW